MAAGAGQAAFGNANLGMSNDIGGLGGPAEIAGMGGDNLGNGGLQSNPLGAGASSMGGIGGMMLAGNGLGGGSMKKVNDVSSL